MEQDQQSLAITGSFGGDEDGLLQGNRTGGVTLRIGILDFVGDADEENISFPQQDR